MIVEIKNFGPIEHLKFDLDKDMHLLYGKNAIGKSYATYCLYCLLKNIKNKNSLNKGFSYQSLYSGDSLKLFIKNIIKLLKKNKDIDCSTEFNSWVTEHLRDVILVGLGNSLQNTFSSLTNLKNRFSNKAFEIILTISPYEIISIFSNDEGKLDLSYTSDQKVRVVEKNTKSTKYSIYLKGKRFVSSPTEEEFIEDFDYFSSTFTDNLLRSIDFNIRDIYYLPASRSGLYQALNAFAPIIAKLTQNRFFMQNSSIELPSLSEPLSDYFLDLSTVDKKHANKEFSEIIKFLQEEILTGEVDYDAKTNKITFKPTGIDLELNLSEASSMVSELSPLVLFLKHIINNKFSPNKAQFMFGNLSSLHHTANTRTLTHDILFIEEPEAHLHPEVQIKLIEVFAQLAKLNIKLFITSHSNYMFNKINNIIIKQEIDENKIAVYHLIHDKNGTKQNEEMTVTEDGINDENFQDVSEKLYNERMEYLEKENDR